MLTRHEPAFACRVRTEEADTVAHLLPLLELCEHDNGVTLPLPRHPPEVLHRVRKRALRGNEVVLLSIALGGGKTHVFIIIIKVQFKKQNKVPYSAAFT